MLSLFTELWIHFLSCSNIMCMNSSAPLTSYRILYDVNGQHIHTTRYSVFHLPPRRECSNMYVLTTTLQASSALRFISNFWRRNPNFIGWAAYISSWVFLSQHALFFRNKFSVLYWLKLKTLDKTFLYYQHLTFKRVLILISPCNDLRLF